MRWRTRARSSSRKRAQSARNSSDTNSPGSSGSGTGEESALWLGSRPYSPPRCGNCGNSLVEPQSRRLGLIWRDAGLYDERPPGGMTRTGKLRAILGKSGKFCAASRSSVSSLRPSRSVQEGAAVCLGMALRGRRSSSPVATISMSRPSSSSTARSARGASSGSKEWGLAPRPQLARTEDLLALNPKRTASAPLVKDSQTRRSPVHGPSGPSCYPWRA